MAKLYGQDGLKGIGAYPVTANTKDEYTVGAEFDIPYAQNLTIEDDVSEANINADDKTYYHARNTKGANVTLTVAQLTGELRQTVEGGTWDEATKSYIFKDGDVRPTLALRNRATYVDDSGFNVEYLFACDVLAVEMAGDKATRGDTPAVNGVNIIMYAKKRECDGAISQFYECDNETDADAAEATFIKGIGGTTP